MKDPGGHSTEDELERGPCGGEEPSNEAVAPSRGARRAEAAWMVRRGSIQSHAGGDIRECGEEYLIWDGRMDSNVMAGFQLRVSSFGR